MSNSKNRMRTFILTLVYIVPISAANNQIKEMVEREYESGENRHFHPGMNACDRYPKYAQLCCNRPGCCVSTPEEGQELIESYTNSQKKTCQGVEINNNNFEARNAKVMIEAITKKQSEDLEAYYLERTLHNPEKQCVDCLNNTLSGTICASIIALALHAPAQTRIRSLQATLLPNIDRNSIAQFVLDDDPYILPGFCLVSSLNCLCYRIANL